MKVKMSCREVVITSLWISFFGTWFGIWTYSVALHLCPSRAKIVIFRKRTFYLLLRRCILLCKSWNFVSWVYFGKEEVN